MIVDVKTPELSESIAEGTLLEWHKQVGEQVQRDETLIDLETDKVILEIAAPCSGMVVELLRENGAVVTAGEVIARIDNGEHGESIPIEPVIAGVPKVEQIISVPAETHEVAAVVVPQPALPLAEPVATPQIKSHRQAMSRLRLRIAERLVTAQHTAAILTTFNEVNMQPIKDLRERYQADFVREHDVKLGFMSFFVKAAVLALQQFPVINAAIDGSDMVYYDEYHVGIAVSTSRGLVVPVLRHADQLGFSQIEQSIADLAKRAEAMALGFDELQGGTFSISNGGVFGSLLSTPIINPPQSAILGMHAIQDRPIAENGQVVIRPMMYLALSYDHRLIDGRDAVRFLVEIKTALEDPARLMLGL